MNPGQERYMIPNQRHLFELPDEIAYFNCSFTSPLLRAAHAAGQAAIDEKRSPWRILPQHFFETAGACRAEFARLIGCDARNVALVPAVSYGIALAANNIPVNEGQTIVLLEDQFPSNVYAWRELATRSGAVIKTVARPQDDDWTTAVLDALETDTAIAALPNCHWTDGGLLDLAAIGRKCRSLGTALVIDGIQSVGAMPFAIEAVQPDFLVAAAHKWLLGPYSFGYCYIADRWLDGRPLEENWLNRQGSEDFARLVDYQDNYQEGAQRFDVGAASNFFLAPIALAALKQINTWGVEAIASTLQQRTADMAATAVAMGFQVIPADLRAPHMVGLNLPKGLPEGLPQRLALQNVYVSVRGDSIRLSPHLYNTSADVERLFAALAEELG
jgi:selenocysteine lyase/cysteine desulfurase